MYGSIIWLRPSVESIRADLTSKNLAMIGEAILEPAAEYLGFSGTPARCPVAMTTAVARELFDKIDQLSNLTPAVGVVGC